MVLNDLTRSMNSLTESVGEQFEVITVSFDPSETPDLAAAKKQQYLRAYRRPHAEAGLAFSYRPAGVDFAPDGAVGFRYAWDAKISSGRMPAGWSFSLRMGTSPAIFTGLIMRRRIFGCRWPRRGKSRLLRPRPLASLLYCFHYDPATGRYGLARDAPASAWRRYHPAAAGGIDLADDSPGSAEGLSISPVSLPDKQSLDRMC